MTRLVEKAELADAITTCSSLEGIFAAAPEALLKSEIMADMKVRQIVWFRMRDEHSGALFFPPEALREDSLGF